MGFLRASGLFLLEWGARAAAGLALVYSIYFISLQFFWIRNIGGVSPFSLGSASVLYLLSQYQFARDGRGKFDSMVLAVLFVNSFLQSYEVIYHFTFPILSLSPPFIQGNDLKFLLVELTMVAPLLLLRKNLSFKKSTILALGAFLASMAIWVLFGFPQYFAEGYFFTPVLKTNDPFHLALALNYISKIILAVAFVTLLNIWKRGPRAIWQRTAKRVEAAPEAQAS